MLHPLTPRHDSGRGRAAGISRCAVRAPRFPRARHPARQLQKNLPPHVEDAARRAVARARATRPPCRSDDCAAAAARRWRKRAAWLAGVRRRCSYLIGRRQHTVKLLARLPKLHTRLVRAHFEPSVEEFLKPRGRGQWKRSAPRVQRSLHVDSKHFRLPHGQPRLFYRVLRESRAGITQPTARQSSAGRRAAAAANARRASKSRLSDERPTGSSRRRQHAASNGAMRAQPAADRARAPCFDRNSMLGFLLYARVFNSQIRRGGRRALHCQAWRRLDFFHVSNGAVRRGTRFCNRKFTAECSGI